jgi:HAE1 family hydrophobic/amphiphilic exporter-1
MYLLDYTVDNLSLMALTLSVGFVVDDAIVVLENIVRHLERGASAFQAALSGSREIGFTVISMTVSLAAVFIPVLFMGGMLGRMLSEFAVTIGAAILVSGFVSLTLTPLMCSRLLRAQHAAGHGRLYRLTERVLDAALRLYDLSLTWVLRHRRSTMAVLAVILVATGWLYVVVPKGFMPAEDTGRIFAQTEAAQGTSFESMVAYQQSVAGILQQDPRIESFMSSIGQRGGMAATTNTGTLFMKVIPRAQRTQSVEEILQDLRPALSRTPGLQVYLQMVPSIRLGGQLTKSQYQYTLQGPDVDELQRSIPPLVEQMSRAPGFQDVTSDLEMKNPQLQVDIDRDKIATLGITAEQVEIALGSAYGQRQVSTIYGSNNQYPVILQVMPEFQKSPAALPLLHVRSAAGQLVPIDALARTRLNAGPLSINHLGQLPAVTISFNLEPGFALGPAVREVERIARTLIPPTITGTFQGTAQAFKSSLAGMEALLVVSILVIYLVLGVLYESYVHPLTILTALPFAGFGALLALLAFRSDLNLYAFVGIIMLVGLVKKNGIMMIDFAIEARRGAELSAQQAIHQACLVRFRPIMMTTLAALAGTLPIALGLGAGGEARRPLGLAVVGGLLFSQSLTLYVTPVFYLYMEELAERARRWRARRRSGSGLMPAAAVD